MRITITNDGATILRSVPVENPAAKVLVDIARIQDDTVGDGTTRFAIHFTTAPTINVFSHHSALFVVYLCSVTVLCGELLREAEFLVNQRVHPMTIMQGWRLAVQIARAALEQVRPLCSVTLHYIARYWSSLSSRRHRVCCISSDSRANPLFFFSLSINRRPWTTRRTRRCSRRT